MKYIDADKLIAEIERLKSVLADQLCNKGNILGPDWVAGGNKMLNEISSIITTLQQEQPEISNNLVDVDAVREDFMTEVYRVLDADPTNDRANAIINAFDSLPTVSREQPAVDLVKEIESQWGNISKPDWELGTAAKIDVKKFAEIAMHFSGWGAEHLKK